MGWVWEWSGKNLGSLGRRHGMISSKNDQKINKNRKLKTRKETEDCFYGDMIHSTARSGIPHLFIVRNR